MPHAEKNCSRHVHDSSIEPCLKKSRPDHCSPWAKRGTDLYQEQKGSQNWTFSSGLEERCYRSDRCEGRGGGIDVKCDLASLTYLSGQSDVNKNDCNKTSQHSFIPPGREKPEHNSDVTFSGTSTSFIGPLYRPSPPVKSPPEGTSDRNAAHSYKIATVELGKSASQSKGQDGMDYELRQFYKELDELEAEVEDKTKQVAYTDVDIKQCMNAQPDKAPATRPSSYPHGQVPTSQPFGPFPSTTSSLASLSCRAIEQSTCSLPPDNPFSYDGQAPYHPSSSFVSHGIPPPRIEAPHPPTFIVPYGPPPPRFHYPITFTRQSIARISQPSHNFNYNARNVHPPWHGSPVPPVSRFTSQASRTFSQSTGERTWKDLQLTDPCRQEDGQFVKQILPPTGNEAHEQYRFRDKRKMVLLRGVPGSGKSTLARTLLQQSPDGIVLSTDDYFCQENGYTYDVKLLGDAHSWNQTRARRALDDGQSPVIIDNTNIQGWEMKPYVQMAVDRGYDVEFLEPDTWWKQDAHELEKRNTHRVPRDKISQMLERFEHDMTVPVVMSSVEPRRHRPNPPPPEARPRSDNVKKTSRRKRYRKNGRNLLNRKHGSSPEENEELANLTVEEKGSGHNVGDCLRDGKGAGKVQVKIICSGRRGRLSDLASLLSHHSNRGAAVFEIVSQLLALMDSTVTPFLPETEVLVTHRRCLLSSSLVIGGMLYRDRNLVRPLLSWLQAYSKGLDVQDQAQFRGKNDIHTSLDLCSRLIKCFAGQALLLYGMKYLKSFNWPKNQLAYRENENQDEKSKQKYSECKQCKDPSLETVISKLDSGEIMDTSKILVETEQKTPVRQKRFRKVYKLAPTFQHPRILSAAQIRNWKDGGDGANHIYTETGGTQDTPKNNYARQLISDDLTGRERYYRAKEERACHEDERSPVTLKCPDGHENSEVKISYSGFQRGAQFCDRLCLSEQFARQLVELFGCPGVDLDAFQPKDFIVPLGYDLAQRIYIKWKTSLEAKYKFLPAN